MVTDSSNSCIQTRYKFSGIAAHAAGDSDRGRSALDAVELMNVGVQFLREHMSDKARVHYVLNDFLLPHYQGDAFMPGSTDVGDVSWQCPAGQIHVVARPNGAPGHSWQNVSCGTTTIGHKSAIHAGKVMAAAVIDLFNTPELLTAARAEHRKRTAAGYTCPIPADAVPTIAD